VAADNDRHDSQMITQDISDDDNDDANVDDDDDDEDEEEERNHGECHCLRTFHCLSSVLYSKSTRILLTRNRCAVMFTGMIHF